MSKRQLKVDPKHVSPRPDTSAVDVLREEMIYFRDYAQPLFKEIIALLYKAQIVRHDLIREMKKQQIEAKRMVAIIAAKIAPFEAPKLSTIESKTENEARFVIQTPSLEADEGKWLENVRAQLNRKQSSSNRRSPQ